MTEQDLIKLSEKVAELYGVPLFEITHPHSTTVVFLHQDLARVMRLVIEHELWICVLDIWDGKYVEVAKADDVAIDGELYKDHPTKEQAVIVAILKALIAMKGE